MMPLGFRQGSRSEYLALYVLSALGIATKIPREEDIGVDFHCSLMELQGRNYLPRSAYNVQVKSVSKKDSIRFGGVNDSGNWKAHEIEWLFAQEVPLFIAIADKETMILRLYPTSNMWYAKYQAGKPGEVHFVLDEPADEVADVTQPSFEPGGWTSPVGDGNRWKVPLGAPLVSIGLVDVEEEDKLNRYRAILAEAIRTEQTNITYGRLKVHWTRSPSAIRTNRGFESQNISIAGNSTPGANTDAQLQALCPILATLAHNYKLQGRLAELNMLKDVVALVAGVNPRPEELEMLARIAPELLLSSAGS
jgi:hypothetical protein